MTDQEIEAGNKLIAQFMGAYPASFYSGNSIPWVYEPYDPFGSHYVCTEDLHYHDSWDWLLSAASKIRSFPNTVEQRIFLNLFEAYMWKDGKEKCFHLAINFINWQKGENGKRADTKG